jgi:hypothetical protein
VEEALKAADRAEVKIAVVSALPPSAAGAARQMCRRLKAQAAGTPVVVGVWQHHASLAELEQRLRDSHPEEIVTTLHDAVARIAPMLGRSIPVSAQPSEPEPESAHERAPLDDGSHSPFASQR